MNISRRQMLIILALLAPGIYGGSEFFKRIGAPPGWRNERWEAGFGSWARGGFGVAYHMSVPDQYHFLQKWQCGQAWISDDLLDDFSIRFSFCPNKKEQENDFADYMKYNGTQTPLRLGQQSNIIINGTKFSRLDFTADSFPYLEEVNEKPDIVVKGFWLTSDTISIISALRDPKRLTINERIVASIKKA